MVKQTKLSSNMGAHYNFGTKENPIHHENGNGYRDMEEFMKWNPNVKVIEIFQEITEKAMMRDHYRYIVFYEET